MSQSHSLLLGVAEVLGCWERVGDMATLENCSMISWIGAGTGANRAVIAVRWREGREGVRGN